MSSEIYNQNYGRSIYNLRLNSLTFSATKNKLWLRQGADEFSSSSIDGIPVETKAKIFSNELIRLVETKQANIEKLNQALSKYLPNTQVEIVSMENYDEFGINTKKNVAAATRPVYDEKGNLQYIKIFVPEIEYGNKISENKYIENLTHEITHAIQFSENKEITKNLKDTPEGKFYNFYQQNLANMLIDTMVTKTLTKLAQRDNIEIKSLDDYDKFLEISCAEITDEELRLMHTPSKTCPFNKNIKLGFDIYLDGLMQKMQVENDERAQEIIEKAGGLEAFKTEIRKMTAHTLRLEEEAYKAGNQARKAARNFIGNDYNDAIWKIISLTADALYF